MSNVLSKEKGLTSKQLGQLNKTLSKSELSFLVNLRYAPDPVRYDKMSKKKLIAEFKYSKYE